MRVYAKIWSLRMIDANEPDITLVGVREIAKSFVNLDGGSDTTVINVVPRFDPYDDRQQEFVTDIRELIIPSVAGLGEAKAYVGGPTANFMDFRDDLYGKFPYLVGAVLLLTFVLLMMFFQSVFLPLKAILLNLCSILATFGVLTLIFQHGWGSSLFGFTSLDSIAVITPAILFVILFSLSTDYEVFLDEHLGADDRRGRPARAVVPRRRAAGRAQVDRPRAGAVPAAPAREPRGAVRAHAGDARPDAAQEVLERPVLVACLLRCRRR